jgi:serine/threonine protein kinase
LEQWLLGYDGHVKLNDMNNAVIPTWNPATNEYCPFRVSYAYIFRSPEELMSKETDERADVFALGLIFYTLLTGLAPFYHRRNWDEAMNDLMAGEKPFLHDNFRNGTVIQRGLIAIMELTWTYGYRNRVDIFHVVSELRNLVQLYETNHPMRKISSVTLRNLVM